ncbi:MAG: J domain-containing protein [Anaerolineae bacterium]|nr:J domain-containing protein [Anaerolineae bacterium]
MNINTNYVNAHLVYQLEYAGLVIEHNSFDIVVGRLPNGERIAFHLIERDIDVDYIGEMLRYNAARGMSTLLLLWCAMLLPDDGALYPPYDWMWALVELYGGRIYAYENEGPTAWLFPVHFDAAPGTTRRHIRYGEVVNMLRLETQRVHTEGHLPGDWRVAGFGEMRADDEPIPPPRGRGRRSAPAGRRHPLQVYFDALGVPSDADFEAVRRAYRALARQHHPDLNPAAASVRRMQDINRAYAVLLAQWFEAGE